MKKVAILGVPIDLGAQNLGVDIGPNAFRYFKIKEKLAAAGFIVSDLGNIICKEREKLEVGNPRLRYFEEILRVSEESAKLICSLIKKGEKVVVLGGDHSACLGAVSGTAVALDKNLGLIYLDAHGDINTEETTLTGNIHGMHLASLLGFGNKDLVNIYGKGAKIKKQNLLHIGGNDFDRAELELIEQEKLKFFKIFDLLSNGLGPLFEYIDKLCSQVKNVWVSLDLDVVDGIYAPGTGIPNKAGLSYREITTICDYIGQNCGVAGLDIVEYNPIQDIENKTAELGVELAAKLLGSNFNWYTDYMEKNKL